ncbi:extracellular solute-binding protein [Paenibacillus solisilvae]|uniref:Extracellular solute-binding protein n=1 Tax=Paenibacillus solisilvae TaxID=2486751 RepID=A0ABW0W8M2_9BACL
MKTNGFTKYVEEKFNIKINWQTAPASDLAPKQSLLLASGDYPEVFWNGIFSPSDILKYSGQGMLLPLNDLLKEYAPNVWKAIETVPGLKEITVAPDGNIYGLPNYNYCFHCFWPDKLWLDTTVLKQYGLQMPTTTEEFKSVLKVFKENNLIPLTGDIDGWHADPTIFLMNAFIYHDGTDYFNINNGKVIFAPAQPEWKQGLEYIHDLYAEGLIDPQTFSQKEEVVIRNISQDKVAIAAHGGSNIIIQGGSANPEYKNWLSVPPLKGPDGVQYAAFYGNIPTSLTFAMTNKATKEQQIAIMKLLDYIWTAEGTQTLNFGAEGEFWTKAEPGKLGLDGKQALFNTAWDKFYAGGSRQNSGWDQMGPIYQSEEWRNGGVAVSPFSKGGDQTMLHLETMRNMAGHQPELVYPGAVWISEDDNQQYSLYKTNINKYVEQWTAEFIVGSKSIDKNWEQYISGLQKLDLEKYLAIAEKAMNEPFDTSGFKSDSAIVKYLLSIQ